MIASALHVQRSEVEPASVVLNEVAHSVNNQGVDFLRFLEGEAAQIGFDSVGGDLGWLEKGRIQKCTADRLKVGIKQLYCFAQQAVTKAPGGSGEHVSDARIDVFIVARVWSKSIFPD